MLQKYTNDMYRKKLNQIFKTLCWNVLYAFADCELSLNGDASKLQSRINLEDLLLLVCQNEHFSYRCSHVGT